MAFLFGSYDDMLSLYERQVEKNMNHTDLCFFYHHQLHGFDLYGKKSCYEMMTDFRPLFQSGRFFVMEDNCKEFTIKDRTYYSLVVQGHELNPDPGALLLCSFLVRGYVYFFKRKENRDSIFEYFKKNSCIVYDKNIKYKISEEDEDEEDEDAKKEKEEEVECPICFKGRFCQFKTNCCKQLICSECACFKKNNSCPYCRFEKN